MNRLYTSLVFFISFLCVSAQSPEAIEKDSLRQLATDSLYQLALENRYKNPLRANAYITSYYKRVNRKDAYPEKYKATYLKAEIYNVLGQKDSAYFFVDESLQLATQANDEENYYHSLRLKGSISFTYHDHASALTYYTKVYEYYKKLNDVARLAKIRHSMALIENQIGRRKQALMKAKENLHLYNEGILDKQAHVTEYLNVLLSVSNSYTTIADDFTEERTKYLDSAMTYNTLGLQTSYEVNDLEIHSIFLLVQGIIYQKKGAFSQALTYLNDSEKLILKLSMYNQLSVVYLHQGKNYFFQNEIDNALRYLHKADSIITKDDAYSHNLQETYSLLAKSYEKKKDVNTASTYWNIFQKKNKENEVLMRKVSENLYKKYYVPSFVNKIELLEKEAKNKQFLS
ncbi:MAG: hypothetical protein AAF617_18040, partial [Bacteroidota bacterium]